MAEHFYSQPERRAHLEELIVALEVARDAVAATSEYAQFASAYQNAIDTASNLVTDGWSQVQLRDLAESVPDPAGMEIVQAYAPPGRTVDGRFKLAEWFAPIEPKLEAALSAARRLREVGYY